MRHLCLRTRGSISGLGWMFDVCRCSFRSGIAFVDELAGERVDVGEVVAVWVGRSWSESALVVPFLDLVDGDEAVPEACGLGGGDGSCGGFGVLGDGEEFFCVFVGVGVVEGVAVVAPCVVADAVACGGCGDGAVAFGLWAGV